LDSKTASLNIDQSDNTFSKKATWTFPVAIFDKDYFEPKCD
jgi:hypothetical protein